VSIRLVWAAAEDLLAGYEIVLERGQNQSSSCVNDYADLREQSPHQPVIVTVRSLGRQPTDVAGFKTERTGRCLCGCQAIWELHDVQVAKSRPSKALRITARRPQLGTMFAFGNLPWIRGRVSGCFGSDESQRYSGGSSHEPKNDSDASGKDSTRLVAQRVQDSCSHGRAALLGTVVSVRFGAPLLRCTAAVARLISRRPRDSARLAPVRPPNGRFDPP